MARIPIPSHSIPLRFPRGPLYQIQPLMMNWCSSEPGPITGDPFHTAGWRWRLPRAPGPSGSAATIPFVYTGQIGIGDEYENEQRISGTHLVPFLTLPARNHNYAREVGSGKEVGEPFLVPRERADELIARESGKKNVFLYIPLFNDCRTYICKQKAKLQGSLGIWCHLLLKGYW